ncbi:CD1845 family protein [Christensenellaceae bacterium OttesenSCG-928-L17]|nr:CD1845 family protein [Christensenellaceae bacterium OttesenSCG-928-L17]
MRLLLKILAAPAMLLLALTVAFCTFLLSVAGFLSWILSVLVAVGAALLFISHQPMGGIAFLVIAFLISPYGLPALAAWVVGKLDGLKFSLRDFIMG